MLHLEIEDGAIVREAGTRHGTQRGTPMKDCYARLSQQTTEIHVPDDGSSPVEVEPVVLDNVLHEEDAEEHTPLDTVVVGSENLSQLSSQFTYMDSNALHLSQESSSQAAPAAIAQNIYASLALKAEQHPVLQNHLIAGLRHIRGKQDQLLAQGVALTPTTSSFPERTGDNSLKRRRSFLEFPLSKRRLSISK